MDRSSQPLSSALGMTLVELMIAVILIAILATVAVPLTASYRTREQARSHAEAVATVVRRARDLAKTTGQPTWVLFDDPDNPAGTHPAFGNGVYAVLARDVDMENNYQIDADSDLADSMTVASELVYDAVGYGLGGIEPFSDAALPDEDIVSATVGSLADLANGTTFGVDPATGLAGVAFTSQGVPVSIAPTAPSTTPPGAPGSGAGAYYVTDNRRTVYAVIVRPLGDVTIRVLDPAAGTWR